MGRPKTSDKPGDRYGSLVLLERTTPGLLNATKWLCLCDCGTKRILKLSYIRYRSHIGKPISCKCSYPHPKHGEARKGKWTPEFMAWKNMRARCLNPNEKEYKNYGGRGISICAKWLTSFQNFLQDVGRRPTPNHSLDRVNNDGNYEPGNIRWATRSEQALNRRYTRRFRKSFQ